MAQFLSKLIVDLIVYLTPSDHERSSNPSSPTVTTESLIIISNLSSLEPEQARACNEENKQPFTGMFILQPLKQRYLIERHPISKSSDYYDWVVVHIFALLQSSVN